MSRIGQATDTATEWILRQEDGPWGEAEQAELDAWLAQSDGNKAAYWRIERTWRQADRIAALGRAATEPRHSRFTHKRWWLPPAIAASIAAMAGTGYLLSRPAPPAQQALASKTVTTPVGGHRLVGLADGSKVELNTASKVRAAVTTNAREVWIDHGEAFFDVRHIEGEPFVVHAGNRRVTVLGTKFSVRRDGDKVTVSVLEGKVRVDEMQGNKEVRSATISAGDIALTRGGATFVTAKSEERVTSALAWREGMLSFDQERLGDIATEFNRYNPTRLIVADTEAANMRIAGVFPAKDPQAFVRLLRDAYGLKIQESGDEIKISN